MKLPKTDIKIKKKLDDLNNQIKKIEDKRPVLESEINVKNRDIDTLKTEIKRLMKLSHATSQSKYKNEFDRLKDKLSTAETERAALISELERGPNEIQELKKKILEIQNTGVMAYALKLQSYLWFLRSISREENKDLSKDIQEVKEKLNTTKFFDGAGKPTHHISVALTRIDRGDLT